MFVLSQIGICTRVLFLASCFLKIYVFLLAVNCIGLFTCLLVIGINSNVKAIMESMEGPIGARIVPTVALNALPLVFGAPPPIMGLGVQLNKWVGRKKSALVGGDVHIGGR